MTSNRVKCIARLAVMAGLIATSPALAESENTLLQQARQQSVQLDTTPGPAYATIDGTVSRIDGEVYTVQQTASNDYVSSGIKANELRVFVGKETKRIGGEKRVGDKIRAEVTHGGFANSIQ